MLPSLSGTEITGTELFCAMSGVILALVAVVFKQAGALHHARRALTAPAQPMPFAGSPDTERGTALALPARGGQVSRRRPGRGRRLVVLAAVAAAGWWAAAHAHLKLPGTAGAPVPRPKTPRAVPPATGAGHPAIKIPPAVSRTAHFVLTGTELTWIVIVVTVAFFGWLTIRVLARNRP